jgi:hypothetical protein
MPAPTPRAFASKASARVALVLLTLGQLCLPTSSTTFAAGSSALSFNGTDSRARFATLPALTVFTVEAWVKRTADTGRYETFVSNASSGYSQATFVLYVDGGNTDCGSSPPDQFAWSYIKKETGWFFQCSGITANLNAWHHIAVTRDAANAARIFIDGLLRGTIDNTSPPVSSTGALTAGEAADALTEYFPGLIDELRVSDTARHTSSFETPGSNFNADANTVALYHFDEGSGTTTADASGRGNTGTLVNALWTTDVPFSGTLDTVPPSISGVSADSITSSRAVISWATNEPATSRVEYGITTAYGASTTADLTLTANHSQLLTGLTANTIYNYRVISKDAAGNQAASGNFTFTTFTGGGSPPVISNVTASQLTPTGATISWRTDVVADTQVEYGVTTTYGLLTPLNPSLVTSHSASLSGLSAGQTYHYRVLSRGQSDLLAISVDATFTTATSSASTYGEWSPVITWPLVAVHAALLPTGDVVMWDAWETPGTPSGRLWNPTTQVFTSVPVPSSALFCAGHTYLADARPMVIGGHHGSDIGIADTNAFDPATNNWLSLAPMFYSRWYPTAVALSDGRLLALGGEITPQVSADVPEVYDPATNTWTLLSGATLGVGEYPPAVVAPDGRVFVGAGEDSVSRTLDVGTQTWSVIGTSPAPTGTYAMYRAGKVMATGGGTGFVDPIQRVTAVIDLNQATPTWRQTSPMAYPRVQHNLVLLPDGKVLAIGGSTVMSLTSTTGTLPAEMWDPATETWTTMAAMNNLRLYHSVALLLPDGRVLAAGGGRISPAKDYLTAEIYSPPYLFKGARPTITSAPGTVAYDATIPIETPDQAGIASVSFIRLPSVTHTHNMSSRFLDLTFTHRVGGLDVRSPASPNVAPPGYYMLFVVNSNGVPSVAAIMKLGGAAPPDVQPPSVSITVPTNGATLSGTVNVAADAGDNVGVASVQFMLDGAPYGAPLASPPYTISWDTTTAINGGHTLGARALDAAGNSAMATPVTVTVANSAGGPTVTASVNPTAITLGGTATLSWSTTNATSVTIDQGIGPVALSGSRSVSPSATTTYTVTATNAAGSATATATLTVNLPPPLPTATLDVSPATITAGGSATLSWSTTNATTVSIDGGIGVVGTTGSRSVSPTTTTTYTLTAANITGSATATAILTVTPAPPPSSSSSLQFNGSNSRARFTTLPAMTVFTVEAWVKRTADTGRYETFLSNANSGYGQATVVVYVDGGNTDCGSSPPDQFAWAYTRVGGGWFFQCSGVTANLNAWHHIAVTRDGANVARIFIDGVLRGTIAGTAAPTGSTGAFGAGDAGDAEAEYFPGLLDEVRISSVARYATSFLPQTVNFVPDANTVALYHFDEGTGQTLSDASGNNRNGFLGTSSAVEAADPRWSPDVLVR